MNEITSNLSEVRSALTRGTRKLDQSAMLARDEMMSKLIELAQGEIQGERGVVARKIRWVNGEAKRGGKVYDYSGDKAVPGQPPKNRTGNLRRSIRGSKLREGFASYSAVVGPQMIYARRVELGGGNWQSGVNFPYMAPAFEKFKPYAEVIIRKNLGGFING